MPRPPGPAYAWRVGSGLRAERLRRTAPGVRLPVTAGSTRLGLRSQVAVPGDGRIRRHTRGWATCAPGVGHLSVRDRRSFRVYHRSVMPTYVYEIITRDGSQGETFEAVQRMSDPPLTAHPETGAPCRRIPAAPTIPGNWSDHATKQKLSDRNLDRLGFTKYERAGGGHYEKKAGRGPDVLSSD